jgi:hypothetical protein
MNLLHRKSKPLSQDPIYSAQEWGNLYCHSIAGEASYLEVLRWAQEHGFPGVLACCLLLLDKLSVCFFSFSHVDKEASHLRPQLQIILTICTFQPIIPIIVTTEKRHQQIKYIVYKTTRRYSSSLYFWRHRGEMILRWGSDCVGTRASIVTSIMLAKKPEP